MCFWSCLSLDVKQKTFAYSMTDSGIVVVLSMIPGVDIEALAFQVSNIMTLIAKLRIVTRWFHTNLETETIQV